MINVSLLGQAQMIAHLQYVKYTQKKYKTRLKMFSTK